ncbi:V-type proton ATPase 116 kDa subunit a1-like [Zophobas morio]|uniref:V-type proton ATPase 116 kDa subunit a1-like n=1 Tax=Zophobas morio TaxID=2755281 RepID=UPI003083E6E6
MGDFFRSEEMALAQLFIQPETAYFAISELGESGIVQFRDLNEDVHAFQRKFVNEVRRCDEMERQLRYIEAEVKKHDIPITEPEDLPRPPNPRQIIDLEAHLEKTESDIKQLTQSAVNLKSDYLDLIELKHVLEKTQPYFNESDDGSALDSVHKALITEDAQNGRLSFVAGVIGRERVPGFERMLWRISRGNVFVKQVEIDEALEDPVTGHENYKTVFVIFFQGEQLHTRINKVCAGFRASVYACPSDFQKRSEMLTGVSTRLEDLNMVLNQTRDHRERVLVNVAKELQNWSIMVSKMKAIYHTLNFFNMDVTNKCLIGECWVPTKDLPIVQKTLSDLSATSGSSISSFLNTIDTKETPPTFNRTNRFTQGFQNLIDSYGMASYREVNPALYTIITFPFLFAVMFGDVGHAIIMACFGGYLVYAEKSILKKKITSEIFNIFFSGRYIILLMGIFSIYTGVLYNDFFSKAMNIFGSTWFVNLNREAAMEQESTTLDPRFDYTGSSYFMGLDPAWQFATNKIIFFNTFKMKLSIVIGVLHMMFGVCVSVINFVYFRKYSSIFLEFLPQILLLCFLFLWMVVMMFMKWIWYSCDKANEIEYGSSCAPSILVFFINMMLFKEEEQKPGCEVYMFEGQQLLQQILVYLSLLCIPVLLLGKPLYVKFTRKAKPKKDSGDQTAAQNEDEEEEPISEIFIHQVIHTIEYVLSTISHTASYLRLWALSLAHAQLSEVLWNRLFQIGLKSSSYVGAPMTVILFSVWAFFTVAILVLMEGLSAFLHTLRLHWVEFLSKFYQGEGYPFEPFSFKAILEQEAGVED